MAGWMDGRERQREWTAQRWEHHRLHPDEEINDDSDT